MYNLTKLTLSLILISLIVLGLSSPVMAQLPPPPTIYVDAPSPIPVSTEFDIIIWIRNFPSGWGMVHVGILAEWDPNDLEYIECEFLGSSRPGWSGDCSWPDLWEGIANGPRWTGDAAWFRIRFHCLREGPTSIRVSSPPLGTVVLENSVGTQEAVFPEPVTVTIYQGLGPVGGVASPVNKLEMLTPYLALAGLIMAVSTVFIIRRRKD